MAPSASWLLEYIRAGGLQALRAVGVGRRPSAYVWDRVAEHRACWSSAAEAIGAELVDLGQAIWEVRRGEQRTKIANHLVQLDDPVVLELAGDKEASYRLGEAAGARIAEYIVVDARDVDGGWRQVKQLGVPVVVKPARGTSSGVGVTVAVRARHELVRAMALAGTRSPRVIVQRMVAGESCRLLFLDGKLIHAVRRRGLAILGDGRSSIAELLATASPSLRRDDRLTQAFLAAARLNPQSIPPAGERVLVRPVSATERRVDELRTIYDEDITDAVGPALVGQARLMVEAIGSVLAGVDVVTTDVSQDLSEAGGAIIEINTTPGILHHCLPRAGACPVAVLILERLLRAAP